MLKSFLSLFFILILAAAPASAQTAGQMNYDTSNHRYVFYDGVSWREFHTGLGLLACTKEGAMDFEHVLAYYRYCNGSVWVPVVGTLTLSTCSKKGEMDFFSNSYYFCNGLFWVNMQGGTV